MPSIAVCKPDPLPLPTTETAVRISLTDDAPEHRMLLATLSTHIAKSKRAIIVTGAGISCNAGIPVPSPPLPPPSPPKIPSQLTPPIRTFVPKMDYTISSRLNIPNTSSRERISLTFPCLLPPRPLPSFSLLSRLFDRVFSVRGRLQRINSFGQCMRGGNWYGVIRKISMESRPVRA
jgi:hypothetical protein